MAHSNSLRAIGQSLEILGVESFVIEKQGQSYVVRSDSLPADSELVFRPAVLERLMNPPPREAQKGRPAEDRALQYNPVTISWLNAQGRKKRRKRFSSQLIGAKRISQLLRTLGKHLDRVDTSRFKLSWSPQSIFLDYETMDGQRIHENLTVEELSELGLRMRFRRARRR